MFKKKLVYITSLIVIIIFIVLVAFTTYALNKVDINEVRNNAQISEQFKTNNIENEIRLKYLKLRQKQKTQSVKKDDIINTFLQNVIHSSKIYTQKELKNIWQTANKWVTNDQLFDINDEILGNVIGGLKTAKIIYAHVYPRGTQLKILLSLEGDQKAVFKPQWYTKDVVVEGDVYAGNDRYGAEILAFYLSGILNIPLAPIATQRIININEEIIPFGTKTLLSTTFQRDNKTCIYGKCFYCTKDKPVCESSPGKMYGAIIFHVPGKFSSYRSPWQRTYKKGKRALWEYEDNYCKRVKQQLAKNILLDLIDTAIFDFLIQNGDRHHYETLRDRVILFDNGKGLGNPYIHHIDILAPLYQCCTLRTSTLKRLKILSASNLTNILESIPEIVNVVSDNHLRAMEERLLYIFAAIEICIKEKRFLLY